MAVVNAKTARIVVATAVSWVAKMSEMGEGYARLPIMIQVYRPPPPMSARASCRPPLAVHCCTRTARRSSSTAALRAMPVPVTAQRRDDPQLGEPLCPDCYDYTGTVLFNAAASELWRRFTITLRRSLARQAGLTNRALAARIRVSSAKVAEYQRRGVVHFHASSGSTARPDQPRPRPPGPHSAYSPPPSTRPPALSTWKPRLLMAWPLAPWCGAGRLTPGRPVTTAGELTDAKVAAYVAKYATKAAECTGTLDRRITPADQLDLLPIREHARRHIAECIRLSKLPGLEDLRLAAWAHIPRPGTGPGSPW